jgi:pantoate--beta-alanine ligase
VAERANLVLVERIRDLVDDVRRARSRGESVGFVPTMGYLHEGHLSLVRAARRETDRVVVSVFVNPLQFGAGEDLDRYPRDLPRDSALLAAEGVDVLFAPSVEEMYPRPMATFVEVPALSTPLCGRARPTHFRGVATVVMKLLHIVLPDRVYFGQKDGQQVAVVRRMIEDLSVPVTLRVLPTVREPDGLAMSSRNVYLTPEERARARVLFAALEAGRSALAAGERRGPAVAAAMAAVLDREPVARRDYAEVVDFETLSPADPVTGRVLLAVAAVIGRARLIDNLLLDVTADAVRDPMAEGYGLVYAPFSSL